MKSYQIGGFCVDIPEDELKGIIRSQLSFEDLIADDSIIEIIIEKFGEDIYSDFVENGRE
jgi:hypothetical protein